MSEDEKKMKELGLEKNKHVAGGAQTPHGSDKCSSCGGFGSFNSYGDVTENFNETETCEHCNGTGVEPKEKEASKNSVGFLCKYHGKELFIGDGKPNPVFMNQYCNNDCERECKFNTDPKAIEPQCPKCNRSEDVSKIDDYDIREEYYCSYCNHQFNKPIESPEPSDLITQYVNELETHPTPTHSLYSARYITFILKQIREHYVLKSEFDALLKDNNYMIDNYVPKSELAAYCTEVWITCTHCHNKFKTTSPSIERELSKRMAQKLRDDVIDKIKKEIDYTIEDNEYNRGKVDGYETSIDFMKKLIEQELEKKDAGKSVLITIFHRGVRCSTCRWYQCDDCDMGNELFVHCDDIEVKEDHIPISEVAQLIKEINLKEYTSKFWRYKMNIVADNKYPFWNKVLDSEALTFFNELGGKLTEIFEKFRNDLIEVIRKRR